MKKLYTMVFAISIVLLAQNVMLPAVSATDSERTFWFELKEIVFIENSKGAVQIYFSVDLDSDNMYRTLGEVASVSVGNATQNQTLSVKSPTFTVHAENKLATWAVTVLDIGYVNGSELMKLQGIIHLEEPVYAAFSRTWYNEAVLLLDESESSLRINMHTVKGTMNLKVHLTTEATPNLQADFAIDTDGSGAFETDETSNSSGKPTNSFLQLNSSELSSIELQTNFQILLTNLDSNATIFLVGGIWDFQSNVSIPLKTHWFNASEIDWVSYGLRFSRSIREIWLSNSEIVHPKEAGSLRIVPEERIQITVSREETLEPVKNPTTPEPPAEQAEEKTPSTSPLPRIEPLSSAIGAVAAMASVGLLIILWRRKRRYV